jgi:hypothetical protein
MLKFRVEQVENGYKLKLDHASTGQRIFATDGAQYVYKSTEYLQLIEFIGQLIAEKKVKVEER